MDSAAEEDQADEDGKVRCEGFVLKNDSAEGDRGGQANRSVDEPVQDALEPLF